MYRLWHARICVCVLHMPHANRFLHEIQGNRKEKKYFPSFPFYFIIYIWSITSLLESQEWMQSKIVSSLIYGAKD